MLTRCPKCGHAPLPEDQALPAACPACGVILAKIGQRAVRTPPPPDDETASRRLGILLSAVPERVDLWRWRLRAALWLAFAAWGVSLIAMDHRDGEIARSFLHGPLLLFHEAGHVVLMPLGQWLSVLGGTLGQLLMPLVITAALLLKNRDPFGASLGLWLTGVSLLDIAPYVYDALEPQLTLLSGGVGEEGGHDWIYLLRSLGWLNQAQRLGVLVHVLGALVVLAALAWGGWLLRRQQRRIAPGLPDERIGA